MVKIRTINQGGFGVVSLYENKGIYYAVKQLLNKWDPRNWKMFAREIDIMQSLNHPNIVAVNSYNKDQDNPYYVMKYYKEGSLRQQINIMNNQGNWLTEKSASAIVLVLARALAYAHSKGAIHRDLKPENILFDNSNPLIADWGIGKFVHRQSKVYNYNGIGTPPYCSPEQWNYGKSDARSDIYSLGVIFRELITGAVDGDIQNNKLKEIVDNMTAYHPEYRYQSMDEVANEIASLYQYSENPVNDFWSGFGKAALVVGGITLGVLLLAAIFGD
ncbi:MAG: serine/threonine protein kinase [Bacteroidia bacterium]|nr:serine/threonine protein kinase [Bacteroidia bacterium]